MNEAQTWNCVRGNKTEYFIIYYNKIKDDVFVCRVWQNIQIAYIIVHIRLIYHYRLRVDGRDIYSRVQHVWDIRTKTAYVTTTIYLLLLLCEWCKACSIWRISESFIIRNFECTDNFLFTESYYIRLLLLYYVVNKPAYCYNIDRIHFIRRIMYIIYLPYNDEKNYIIICIVNI